MGESRPVDGSITHWIEEIKEGETGDAVRLLWERYFDRLVHLARGRLRASPRGPADEEDVALSAFDSFCQRAAAGRFPQLGGRDDLWRLLVTITARKAGAVVQRERTKKRGSGRGVNEAALAGAGCDDSGELGLAAVVGREPSPAFAAMIADEVRRLLDALGDEPLRQLALLRMEGYSNEQVAERLGCSLRSVERKLERIRMTWKQEEPT